jgi:hypothetical protein
MFRTIGFAVIAAAALAASAPAQAATCAAAIKGIAANAGGLKVDFVRPVIVSRGGQNDGAEVLDIVTEPRIDGQLRCRGDKFLSLTARIPASANAGLRDAFFRLQQATLVGVLQWPASRASRTLLGMTAEAADYLRASIERGDIEVAGKVEEHAGAAGDIGLFWTKNEREFILISEP